MDKLPECLLHPTPSTGPPLIYKREQKMDDCKYQNMSNEDLARSLYGYSLARDGEIAELTRAAAIRITMLAERIEEDDDRK